MGSYALPYRSKKIVVDDQDDVRQAYTNGMQKVFPSLTVQKTPEPYLTLLTDQILAKYSSEKWSNSKQVVLETFPPFYGELYDVYLFVGYQENGIRKHVAFVPEMLSNRSKH